MDFGAVTTATCLSAALATGDHGAGGSISHRPGSGNGGKTSSSPLRSCPAAAVMLHKEAASLGVAAQTTSPWQVGLGGGLRFRRPVLALDALRPSPGAVGYDQSEPAQRDRRGDRTIHCVYWHAQRRIDSRHARRAEFESPFCLARLGDLFLRAVADGGAPCSRGARGHFLGNRRLDGPLDRPSIRSAPRPLLDRELRTRDSIRSDAEISSCPRSRLQAALDGANVSQDGSRPGRLRADDPLCLDLSVHGRLRHLGNARGRRRAGGVYQGRQTAAGQRGVLVRRAGGRSSARRWAPAP